MKRIATIALAVALFALPPLAAQAEAAAPSISLSYFGELLSHPGVALEYSLPFAAGNIGSAWGRAKAGFYLHPRNHSAFFITLGAGGALSSPGGLSWEGGLDGGLFLSKPDGLVYVEDGAGGAVEAAARYEPKVMASASLGLSWRPPLTAPWTPIPFLRLGAFGEWPFNGYFYLHPYAEAGLRIRLGGH